MTLHVSHVGCHLPCDSICLGTCGYAWVYMHVCMKTQVETISPCEAMLHTCVMHEMHVVHVMHVTWPNDYPNALSSCVEHRLWKKGDNPYNIVHYIYKLCTVEHTIASCLQPMQSMHAWPIPQVVKVNEWCHAQLCMCVHTCQSNDCSILLSIYLVM
jgi:hypothetical protein